MKFAHLMVLLLGLFLVNFVLWLYLQRKEREQASSEMNQRVTAAVNDYFALAGSDTAA